MSVRPSPSIMSEEVARFEALGDTWWDPEGPMAPLHRVNPVRIGWARDLIVRHFKLETGGGAPLAGVDLLDVGCGAGLFAEPLARLGANVIGVDPAPAAIEAARHHAEETGAKLVYRAATVEELAEEPRLFDIVSAMEVIEHAADPKRFVATAASLVTPGRTVSRLHSQPHIEKLRPRHRRRRICPALARAWNAPLGAIRDAARVDLLRPRRRPKAAEPARNGLRSVPARLAPLVRHGRELPVRRNQAGRLEPKLNRVCGRGHLGRERTSPKSSARSSVGVKPTLRVSDDVAPWWKARL